MNRAACFTRIPQDDLSDADAAHVWVDENECCYATAFQFFAENMGDVEQAQHVWADLSVRARLPYRNMEKADYMRAAAAKHRRLREISNAPDCAAWTTCFDDDVVIGCIHSLHLYYAYLQSRPIVWVHTSASKVVDHLFAGTRYRAAQTNCNCRECRRAGLAPHWSLEEAEQMVYALLTREELICATA